MLIVFKLTADHCRELQTLALRVVNNHNNDGGNAVSLQ